LTPSSALKNKQIGEFFDVDYSTVSQGRRRLRERTGKDKDTKELVEKIERKLSPIKI
jgi:chromosomal replication initiation ATPase DnaA